MKRSLPWIVTAVTAVLVLGAALRPAPKEGSHWREFGQLPVLVSGRIKPLDTVARTSLLTIHNKQTLRLPPPEGGRLSAIEWLAELCFRPAQADQRRVFVINDPQVLALFGWQQEEGVKNFSFAQLSPRLAEVERQAQLAEPVEQAHRSLFQQHLLDLYGRLRLYVRLKNSLQTEDSPGFAAQIATYEKALAPGLEAMNHRDAGQEFDQQAFDALMGFAARFQKMAGWAEIRVVPPLDGVDENERSDWSNVGESLLASVRDGSVHPVVKAYAAFGTAFRAGDVEAFNAALADLTAAMQARYQPEMRKASHETFFNRYQPFYVATGIYVVVFILACVSWMTGDGVVRRTAFQLGVLAFLIHTSGLAFRVYLQGYAPVTNLYSSALGVGWGAAALGLVLERLYRNGIGSAVTGVIGFLTLIIAHNLALTSGGDTMEMMRAVLDNNFWLATHVVVITIGYSATFLAGFLALLYIVLGVFTAWLSKPFSATQGALAGEQAETNGSALNRMVYGIVCFATIFCFLGTVLGGIWADQSWGRFWGWDPKENGAALIVLWCAIILHARWGGYIRERGLMAMALFGNIVTAWSWFGVNMLGIGLHSYGFMNKAFPWLIAFAIANLALMLLAALPIEHWRSRAALARANAG